jgi:hypothetical protein
MAAEVCVSFDDAQLHLAHMAGLRTFLPARRKR